MVQIKIWVFLVSFVTGVTGYNWKFEYQIIEGSARFIEKIETNLWKNIVKIHTPAHNDVLESYTMQDFEKGQQIICLPSLRQCRLRDIDRTTAPDAGNVTESFVHSWNKGTNSITSANSKVITELYYVNGKEVVNTVSLGEDLKQFYERFEYPLYKEKKIPSDAEVLNITSSTGGRIERDTITLAHDCNGQKAKMMFGIDTGRTCNHLKICKIIVQINGNRVFADCNNVHITAPTAYMCWCCPWVTSINPNSDVCSCAKMSG